MGAKVSTGDTIEPSQLDNIQKSLPSRSSSETSNDRFKTTRRTTTDIFFLLLMTTFFIVFLLFLGYCIVYGDLSRVINGYDDCGNVCGKKNTFHSGDERDRTCPSQDHTNHGYQIVIKDKVEERRCIANCSEVEGYRLFLNRCVPKTDEKLAEQILSKTGLKNFFDEVSEDFNVCWREFLYLCLIALAFSIVIIVLFRYFVGYVVWIVLIGVAAACCICSICLWVLWKAGRDGKDLFLNTNISELNSTKTETYLIFAILASIATVVVILVIIVMRKRIQLVVQLFKESGKAISAMPLLLFQPLMTFLCLAIVVSLWFYFCLWIESSGKITQKEPHVYYYQKDSWMKLTRWYNLFAMFWMIQFIIGCQHMVIAGAVSTWYFTRIKKSLKSPVIESGYNLTRYHLGSVAMGSFLIALVQFVRAILKAIEKMLKGKEGNCAQCVLKCCRCCLYCFEKVLKFLTRNAYIEIAMFGYSFCRASKEAFKLLSANILRVAAINSVGDFVLLLGKILVVIATVLCGTEMLKNKEGLHHMWVPITLAGLFAYVVAHCFITVYEMTIDTIFLCFCEDCEQNDGVSKPYYMSRGLMEFVENSKKALQINDAQEPNRAQAWNQ